MKHKYLAGTTLALSVAIVSVNASAEVFGLLHGRSADPASMSQLSVELGLLAGGDYSSYGARLNYTLSERMSVYGDIGLNDVDDFNGYGVGFGGGLYYYLPNQQFLGGLDVAAHGSYHITTIDSDSFNSSIDVDMDALALDLLISPETPMNDNGMSWFASAGFTRLSHDIDGSVFARGSDADIELSLSGGVTLPMGPGEAYAGVEYVDGVSFGAGFRYGL